MKAEELMIGDYVKLKDAKLGNINFVGSVVQIKSITGRHVLVPNAKGLLEDVTEEYLLPVPLTPEILEKLGFSSEGSTACVHAKCYTLSADKYKLTLTIADYGKYKRLLLNVDSVDAECFNIKCNYLHQLQHALRLCGIEKGIHL